MGGWNWGSAPGQGRDVQAARAPGFGSFWESWKWDWGPRYPGSSPRCCLVPPAQLRSGCGGVGFLQELLGRPWDASRCLFQGHKSEVLWFSVFPLDGGSFLSLCPTPLLTPPARIWDGGSWCSGLWSNGSLPELPPPRQGKAGGTGELEMASERGRTDGFGLGYFFFPSSQRNCMQVPWLSAVIPKAGSCWISQGSASRLECGTFQGAPGGGAKWNSRGCVQRAGHSMSCRSQWLQGSRVPATPSQIQGLTPGFWIFVSLIPLGAMGDVAAPAAHPATFQQISGSVLPKPIKAAASSAPFPAPRWFPGYFCAIGRALYQRPAWSSASPAGGRKGRE